MNLFSKKAPIWGMIFTFALLPTAIAHAQVAPEVEISADSLLCEGEWVTLTATVNGCTLQDSEWYAEDAVGDGGGMEWVLADGTELHHQRVGDELLTLMTGRYRFSAQCAGGGSTEGIGEVLWQDDAVCDNPE